MENNNQTPMDTVTQTTQVVPPTPQKPKSGLVKKLMLSLVAVLVAGLGYVGYSNPQLFRAEITNPTAPDGVARLYIPSFDAGPKDSGMIWVSTRQEGADVEDLVSMQFKLKWSPANAMVLNENSIVFDSETLFKSADLKSVNTSTPGEAILSFFSSNKVAVSTAALSKLVKLNVQLNSAPGSQITLQATDVEVIQDAGITPATDYKASVKFTAIDAGKITIATQANLRVVSAESLSSTQVLVRFSDLLQSVGVVADYQFDGLVASAVASGYLSGYDQKTVIVTTGAQVAGTAYTLEVQNANVVGNTQGNLATNYKKARLFGFASDVALSDVKLSSIEVNSSTSLTLRFSGALKPASVTPVNIKIEKFMPAPAGNLTLVSTTLSDASTVQVITAQQMSDVNYFVSMNGVKDAQDELLANNAVLSFFGFQVPPMVIRSVKPATVTNDIAQTLVVLGENLNTVAQARLGTAEVTISDQTAGALSLAVPKGFAPEVYDLNLVSQTGETATLANSVTVQVSTQPMKIVSAESRAVPNRVAPDGKTEVIFWVLVEDPVGLGQISSVTMDLEQIGGKRAQEMAKDSGTQKQYSQFYTYKTTVAATTPTGTETLKLPVEVRKGTEVAKGTVEILVTKNVIKSVAPTIDQAYTNPSTLAPDGEAKGKISAKITDPDGASTIQSVIADLGAIGVGFVQLAPIGSGSTTQLTGWFSSDEFSVPKATPEKDYTVIVTAEDETGGTSTKTLTLTVSTALNAPKFDTAKSYIGPRKSVPRDGKTPFSVHAMVTDPDGVSDIDSVTAYFGTSGLAPVALIRDPSATETSKSALYNSGDIVFAPVTPLGVQEIELVAVDKAGGKGNLILQVDVTDKDTLAEAPFINNSKAYTSPKIALNDGKTPISLYAFVRDDDNNLESVVVNLTGIGQVGPELPPDFGEADMAPVAVESEGGACPGGPMGIVCMVPSFKEGNLGQWFVLSGVTISKETEASVQPYQVEVMATDASGSVTRGKIPLSVRDNLTVAADKSSPEVVAAVPVGTGSVEVVFSKALDPLSVSADGKNFTITESRDITKKLSVLGSTIDASGMVVTVTTDQQGAGVDYVLTASNKIADAAGIPLVSGRKSQANFIAFADSDKSPVVDFIGATAGDTVQIDFQGNLRPSSVKLGEASRGGDFDIKIFESDSGTTLAIRSVRFVESGKSLEVKTDMQKSGVRYRAQISKVATAAGISLKSAIGKSFVAVNIRAVQKAAVAGGADLNGDGKVDFIDFTMFSAVYGQALGVPDSGLAGGQGLSPIAPAPDSTVSHTSEPQ